MQGVAIHRYHKANYLLLRQDTQLTEHCSSQPCSPAATEPTGVCCCQPPKPHSAPTHSMTSRGHLRNQLPLWKEPLKALLHASTCLRKTAFTSNSSRVSEQDRSSATMSHSTPHNCFSFPFGQVQHDSMLQSHFPSFCNSVLTCFSAPCPRRKKTLHDITAI